MTLKGSITSLAMVSTLTVAGLAFAQQPSQPAQPQSQPPTLERASIPGGTSVIGADGKPITTADQPTVERWKGEGMTNPTTPDGKPITGTTSFGQR
jgi:hypothetical protein